MSNAPDAPELLHGLSGDWNAYRTALRALRALHDDGVDVSFAFEALVVPKEPSLSLLLHLVDTGADLSSVRGSVSGLAEDERVHVGNRVLVRSVRDRMDEQLGELPPLVPLPPDALDLGEGVSLLALSHRPRWAQVGAKARPEPRTRCPCAACGVQGQLAVVFKEDDGVQGCGGSDVIDLTKEYLCAACGKYSTYHFDGTC